MPNELPEDIQAKFNAMHAEVDHILKLAHQHIKTDISGKISFKFTSSAPRDYFTDYERAQSICFIARYELLPIFENADIHMNNGKYFLKNYSEARYVLNEYRPIVQNEKDSIYYQKVHKLCREKLLNNDPSKGLSITVKHKDRGDITSEFATYLGENCKAIKSIIKNCEFSYIYNGILQHSDHKFTKRFLKEYSSGVTNYVFMKHALIVSNVKFLLSEHYRLLNVLIFPKLGPL